MNHIIKTYMGQQKKIKGIGEKPEVMKYVRLALLLCFLAGIIAANLMDKEQLNGFGLWNTYFLERFKYTKIQEADLFYYIFQQRMPVMILLLLFALTNMGMWAGILFLSWQTFAAGFLMAASVISYGIKGIFLMITGFFPQYLFYIPIFLGYIYVTLFWKKAEGGGRKKYLIFLGACLVMVVVYVTGIFLESYVNPYLLKKILNFF